MRAGVQREIPDAETKSEAVIEEDHFFHAQVYKRIETTCLGYMHSTKIIETNAAHNIIKWQRVVGTLLMLLGLMTLLVVFLQR